MLKASTSGDESASLSSIFCPGPIGGDPNLLDYGNDSTSALSAAEEQELYVRWWQLNTFMPMMHFLKPPTSFNLKEVRYICACPGNAPTGYIRALSGVTRSQLQKSTKPLNLYILGISITWGVQNRCHQMPLPYQVSPGVSCESLLNNLHGA